MFVPSNVPGVLLPFLVVIEVISHLAKVFSLAIRLFANMMSGHVLLHILVGFVMQIGSIFFFLVILPLSLTIAIFFLEFGITFLQAYVFLILLSIYFEEHFGFSKEELLILKTHYYIFDNDDFSLIRLILFRKKSFRKFRYNFKFKRYHFIF